MSFISRRHFLAAGSAIVGTGVLPSAARAQQLRQINFITPLNYLIGYAPSLNAQAGGHFKKEGLDVTILPGKGSAVAVQQVIAGRALYGRGDPLAMAKAIGQGAPIIAFATIAHRSPIMVYSSPKKPVRNVKDMMGKVIGIGDYGSASDNILDMMLAMNGLKPDAIRREAIGNSPGGWGLIQQGRVDAHIVSVGTTTVLKEQGEDIIAWPTNDQLPMPGQAYFTQRETLAKEPDLLLKILRAEKASVIEVKHADGPEIVRRVAKLWEVEGASQVDFTAKAMRVEEQLWWQDDTSKILKNDPVSWKTMIDAMISAGFLKSGKPEDFYTDAIVSKL
jgi:ABC-type nitrate/sulfonate/bicarbonate transport system substrate-binding protein